MPHHETTEGPVSEAAHATIGGAVSASTACSRDFVLRAMKWIVHPAAEGTMSDFTIEIEVEDEGGGEFLVIRQPYAHAKLANGGIAIDSKEWPTLRNAIDMAFREIAAAESSENDEMTSPHPKPKDNE